MHPLLGILASRPTLILALRNQDRKIKNKSENPTGPFTVGSTPNGRVLNHSRPLARKSTVRANSRPEKVVSEPNSDRELHSQGEAPRCTPTATISRASWIAPALGEPGKKLGGQVYADGGSKVLHATDNTMKGAGALYQRKKGCPQTQNQRTRRLASGSLMGDGSVDPGHPY